MREGAEELIGEAQETLLAEVEGWEALEDAIKDGGDALTKSAGAVIAKQLATEKARETIPKQLEILRKALTGKDDGGRVIILIDELDRCHPDYALALLEAMKLVFDQPGYVFVLMVNADYLERIAEHRFGKMEKGERYLEKFVDMRLALPMTDAVLSAAVERLARNLPLAVPFGEHEEFSVERAARLAGELAPQSGLSMRQLKRVLLRVEMALRCYKDQPIDCALLVWLAFRKVYADKQEIELSTSFLTRAGLPPDLAVVVGEDTFGKRKQEKILTFVRKNCMELDDLSDDRYFLPDEQNYHWWAKIGIYLAPNYIPRHQAMLDAVHQIEAK